MACARGINSAKEGSAGVVAAGHECTARAAAEILEDGGNAFDAAVAAHLTACVSEPVLSSLAGGGFLMAQTSEGQQVLYDFFCQTPLQYRPDGNIEFYPIMADFGETRQEFHIGMGSFATPGTVSGLFAVHRELCTLPMQRLIEPAVRLAREGVVTNRFQAYIFDIVSPVYRSRPETRDYYGSTKRPGELILEGDLLRQPELADTMEALAREGEVLFRQGEIARMIVQMSRDHGGHVTMDDLMQYRVEQREPLRTVFNSHELIINPVPSSGGLLIAFALKLLERAGEAQDAFGSAVHLMQMAHAQELTSQARPRLFNNENQETPDFLPEDSTLLSEYRTLLDQRTRFTRGTTHISIMDNRGNTASLTTSNGEGCGHMIPGTGIILNNMLGEEDLHPNGFDNWNTNVRIASMMAPAILNLSDSSVVALGSGGSNRLRTAILQVIWNLTRYRMTLEEAVKSPRIHCENGHLSIEEGFRPESLAPLLEHWPDHKIWKGQNLFFGGTHAAQRLPDCMPTGLPDSQSDSPMDRLPCCRSGRLPDDQSDRLPDFKPDRLIGAGDPRRGGNSLRV